MEDTEIMTRFAKLETQMEHLEEMVLQVVQEDTEFKNVERRLQKVEDWIQDEKWKNE